MEAPALVGLAVAAAGVSVLALALGRTSRDAVTLLTLFVVLLFALRAHLVVGPLGGVGTPALLVGLLALWVWLFGIVDPAYGLDTTWQPVRAAVFVHFGFMLLGFAIAHMRPLTELEASGSARSLITLAALSGVALLAADGIGSRERLDVLLRRLVGAAALMAAVGIVQFVSDLNPAAWIEVPGLTHNVELSAVGSRSIFNRPFGTALHPIEFGVVLAIVLPISVHYALTTSRRPARQRSWAYVGLISLAIVASLSRSGILGLAVGLAVLSAAWNWRRRVNALIGAFVCTVAMWATIPGLIGTVRGLFLHWGADPSIQARTDRIPRVMSLVAEAPFFGRGYGTFSPEDYLLLDNQYYETAIESGIIGVLVVVALFVVAASCARGARRRSSDPATRHLGQALAASMVVVLVSMATFDALFYRIFGGVAFLLVGVCGALWRFEKALPPEQIAPADADRVGQI